MLVHWKLKGSVTRSADLSSFSRGIEVNRQAIPAVLSSVYVNGACTYSKAFAIALHLRAEKA